VVDGDGFVDVERDVEGGIGGGLVDDEIGGGIEDERDGGWLTSCADCPHAARAIGIIDITHSAPL